MARPTLTKEQVTAFRRRARFAALALFEEHDDVTLRALAKALGCSHATPYRYFESKEALFMAVRAEAFERFGAYLTARLEGVHDPIARIQLIASGYFAFAQDETGAFRVMFELGQPRHDAYPEHRPSSLGAWSIVEDAVRYAVERNVLVGDVSTLAHLFWSAVHGITTLHLAQRLSLGREGDSLIRPMVDSLLEAHRP
ncbi:MAG: TetR/AcrR family transcriptional regulator [Myxococcota bacterium]